MIPQPARAPGERQSTPVPSERCARFGRPLSRGEGSSVLPGSQPTKRHIDTALRHRYIGGVCELRSNATLVATLRDAPSNGSRRCTYCRGLSPYSTPFFPRHRTVGRRPCAIRPRNRSFEPIDARPQTPPTHHTR